MAVSKHIFSGLDFAVAVVTTGLPNNVAATSLPWGSKKKLNSQCTCIGGKPLASHFPEGNPSATHMLYPSLIVMSVTLELRTQSHHHYNRFEDELSTCIYKPEQEGAFCSQLHRCFPQPEAHWSIPALFLSYIVLCAAWQHRNETPATAATPGCTQGSHCYSRLPNCPRCAFFVIFFHLPTLPFNSMSPSQPAPLSCYYFLTCSVGIAGP